MTLSIFLLAFVLTEFAAWLLHKYVMHGFLWNLHKDHHESEHKAFYKNDLFALAFAIPSFLMILFGNLWMSPGLSAAGYGVMAYGAVYFFVHEVIIHRRHRFFRGRGSYFRALITAHAQHHRIRTKEGCDNFGLLVIHPKYFKDSRRTLTL
jgi:beta-carotene 3-hydroxylase